MSRSFNNKPTLISFNHVLFSLGPTEAAVAQDWRLRSPISPESQILMICTGAGVSEDKIRAALPSGTACPG